MSKTETHPAETPPIDLIGAGGELHQVAGGSHPQMTTNQGMVIADDENSLRANPRGPTLLEDISLLEKLQHFNHERIPERVVHARGAAAHGYFELTDSLAEFTKAEILTKVGVRTPLFTRFSTVSGNMGSADTARDVRGFAVKLYTAEGNWDLVGNNIPVFFIQDAIKFPDLIHAAKQEPDRGFPQAQTAHDTFWDWASLSPESTHMLMWIMSDRAIPRSFRMMEGFGVHTFRLVNAAGVSTYVKFHWRPALGSQSVVWDEALKISGSDPDFHRRDLWDAIDQGSFPEWELAVQLFDEDFADKFDFDILDSTKLIPEEILPLRVVGRMVLDRNPDNYFSETEQVAFCTTHVVPGIDFTNDPLLQGRNQSYLDTQLSRLGGPNFAQLPINAPRCPMRNFQRDGHMQMGIPKGRVSYSPSSLSPTTERQDPVHGFVSFPAMNPATSCASAPKRSPITTARRDSSSSARPSRSRTTSSAAFIFELSKVDTEVVRTTMLSRLANVDETLARRVAEGLGHDAPITKAPTKVQPRTDLAASPMLSILAKFKPTMKGRKVGCLVADGTDPAQVLALEAAAKAVGANFAVIAPKVGGAKGSDGGKIRADFQLAGGPSVLFDAVVLALSKEGAATLAKEAAAVAFVHDAFAHLKVIGHTAGAQALMDKAGVVTDAGVIGLAKPQAFLDAAGKGRVWDREPSVRSVF